MPRAATPKKRIFWLRLVLLLLPVLLAGGLWEVRRLIQPIDVFYGPEDIQSQILFERMGKEAREHPFARTITVNWCKQSGPQLFFNESLVLNRHDGTLEYGVDSSGWFYSHVEVSGIQLLAQAHLENNPASLPPKLDAELRRRGWMPG